MAATYPTGVKTFTPKIDNVDDVMAADINEAYEEIIAVETDLKAKIDQAVKSGSSPAFIKAILGVAGGTTGSIELKGTTSGTVTLKVADVAGTHTLTLPATDGDANQALITNGAGVLSFATPSTVDDTAYDATTWNANLDAPTKNAIRDKVETMDTAIGLNTAKATNATHTGDVTGAVALTIANDAVSYAKMQNISATDKILGRSTAGAGDAEEIACTAAGRALIDDATVAAQRTTLGVRATNLTLTDFTTDHNWEGDTCIESVNESAGLFGLLYLNSAGYKMAKSNAEATLPCVGLQCSAGTGVQTILLRGYAREDTWTWTVGDKLWVSPSTAGLLTATKPTTTGQFVQMVGYAVSADVIYFNPQYVWVEVA